MKNFKRVISAVIAMALSVSSFAAVSANKFSDVADTASYAEAIDVLSALGIVNGYEDGSFKPEGEINRAEAATMIVGALNMVQDAKDAASTSQFADVNEQASWAAGYVNVGVSQGFIHGMGDGTFAPKSPVNYAQMCTMLTQITGYGDYAAQDGGYPTGYTKMATSAGINKGVAVANETNLTRGQVAQMIYNTLLAPMLGITTYKFDGNYYSKLDGVNASEFKSLLSDKYNGFEFKGYVTSLDNKAGEARLDTVRTDYCKATTVKDKIGTQATIQNNGINSYYYNNVDVIIDNGIDLTNSLQQEVRGIVVIDENEKKHLLYATKTEAVETIEFDADSFTSAKYGSPDSNSIPIETIKFDSQNVTLDDDVQIFVNGALYKTVHKASGTSAGTELNNVLKNAVGNIKLAKLAVANVVPTNYNAVFVDNYIVGQVTKSTYKNGVTNIKFRSVGTNQAYNEIEIADNDIDNGSVKVKVMLGDEEIKLQDIEENDVISIKTKYDPANSATKITSTNLDIAIVVSREIVGGKVTSIETSGSDNIFVVDGTEYAAVDKTSLERDMKVAQRYEVIYLDSFGRIYGFSEEAVEDSKNYAIVAKEDAGEYTLVLADGSRKTYEKASNATVTGTINTVEAKVASNPGTTAADWAKDCVVSYKLKASSGELSALEAVTGVAFNSGSPAKYKAEVTKVGSVGMSSSTGIVNVEEAATYKNFKAMPLSDFVNDVEYEGYGFGKPSGATTYSFVVVTRAGTVYSANSRFAVVDADKWSLGTNDDGEVTQLNVLYNGEKTKLDFSDAGVTAMGTPVRGTAFFFKTDSDGLIESVKPISIGQIRSAGSMTTPFSGHTEYIAADWGFTLNANTDIKLVKGIVVGGSTNSVKLVERPASDTTSEATLFDIDAFESFVFDDDCVIYTFDTNPDTEDKDKLDENGVVEASDFRDWKVTKTLADTASNPAGPQATNITSANSITKVYWTTTALPNDDDLAKAALNPWGIFDKESILKNTSTASEAQYALALVVDDRVVELYEIVR